MTEATYEEYKTATRYAKWKYKYGLFVLIGCWICLILLIIYVVIYAKELSTHPAQYMVDKLGVDTCYCMGEDKSYYINRTAIIVMKELIKGLPSF